jgi:ABC-type transport system substrate-binding protein
MTIAQAFNEITTAQGGTPSKGGTIAGAIDALNDTLAGSDQQPAQTIEGAIRLLGEHINTGGGGGGGEEYTITCYASDYTTVIASNLYPAVWDSGSVKYKADTSGSALSKAAAGKVLMWTGANEIIDFWTSDMSDGSAESLAVTGRLMIMPDHATDICITASS